LSGGTSRINVLVDFELFDKALHKLDRFVENQSVVGLRKIYACSRDVGMEVTINPKRRARAIGRRKSDTE